MIQNLKLCGGPHGVAAAEAEAGVVDGAVVVIVWEFWVKKYGTINSAIGPNLITC